MLWISELTSVSMSLDTNISIVFFINALPKMFYLHWLNMKIKHIVYCKIAWSLEPSGIGNICYVYLSYMFLLSFGCKLCCMFGYNLILHKLSLFIYVRFNYNILLLLPPWLIGPKTLNSVVTSVIHPSFLQKLFLHWTHMAPIASILISMCFLSTLFLSFHGLIIICIPSKTGEILTLLDP